MGRNQYVLGEWQNIAVDALEKIDVNSRPCSKGEIELSQVVEQAKSSRWNVEAINGGCESE